MADSKWQKFKNKTKNTYNNVKAKTKKTVQSTKDYSTQIKNIYDKAYRKGWNDCVSLNTPFGSVVVSSIGYGRGISGKRKYLKQKEKDRKLSYSRK